MFSANRNVPCVSEEIQFEVLQPYLVVESQLNVTSQLPSLPVKVNGTVKLDNGEWAEGADVNVTIEETGGQWNTTVDANGYYEVDITAPGTIGDYTVNTTATHNSTFFNITGYNVTELNVTALCKGLKLPQPTVSRHLAILRMAGLVNNRRAGKEIFYSLRDYRSSAATSALRTMLGGATAIRIGPVVIGLAKKK